jgi:glycopeptide antibiotics resistance protein
MPDRFIKPILIIVAVAMGLWILFWAVVNFKKEHRKKISYRAELVLFSFYIYIMSVLTLTVIPMPFNRLEVGINLVPVINTLSNLRMALRYPKFNFATHTFQNFLGNIILFIPLGIFLPFLAFKYRSLIHVIVMAVICSASIETIQFIESFFGYYRYVDIDDVSLNTLGAILGFVIVNNFFLRKDRMPGRSLTNW